MDFRGRGEREKVRDDVLVPLQFKFTITKADLNHLGIFKSRYTFSPAKQKARK